jgi:hypothetical protein
VSGSQLDSSFSFVIPKAAVSPRNLLFAGTTEPLAPEFAVDPKAAKRRMMIAQQADATGLSNKWRSVNKSDQAAFEVVKLLYGQGLVHASAESLSERIRGIQKGFSKEVEFAATVSWLGNCQAIFKVETNPATIRADSGLKAPDFIAFPVVNGAAIPVLIEVTRKRPEPPKVVREISFVPRQVRGACGTPPPDRMELEGAVAPSRALPL